jgi:hypothetical protein
MRRSLLAGIGALAVFILAACSPDQTRQEPLAPTDVGLAKGDGGGGSPLCSKSLISTIASEQKTLFTKVQMATLDPLWTTIKNQCSTSVVPNPAHASMMVYLDKVVLFRGTVEQTRGELLISHMANLILFVDNETFTRNWTVLRPSTLVPGTENGDKSGGAAVLDPAGVVAMATFDGQAGVMINSPQEPDGPHLFTLDPAGCPTTSLEKVTEKCYNIEVYPPVTEWNPRINIGMCVVGGASSTRAMTHGASENFTEVLPDGETFPWGPSYPSCILTHAFLDSWLGREAGPLGRVVARALDYLRPQPLLADDAGESGLGLFTSPFGVASTVIFDDDFSDLDATPDVGDNLIIESYSPGYIQLQNNITALPGSVVVLSQAGGNCTPPQCPTFRLLGTRENSAISETTGSYEVMWSSVQTKPNVKEAPFVILNSSGAEIARLSYVTESSQNKILFKYLTDVGCTPPAATCMVTANAGSWIQNEKQDFKVTVHLTTLGLYPSSSVSLQVTTSAGTTTPVLNQKAYNATSLLQIGYILTGIDAGIIASDNWNVKRIPDSAGNP